MTKNKSSARDSRATAPAAPKPPPGPPPPLPQPAPLFRRIDWLTFFISFGLMWVVYFLTLAPELTLQDSGELAVGSYYAGVPHPPGYPVWTLYTWLWTALLPVGNIAWRVALGEATAGALASGLLGLMVSRGSSMLMEGIEELRNMTGKWENAICAVSGAVAGLLMGLNGFMWSQAVIVEVYLFGVLSFMIVLLCLLRWVYAPHQMRYAYWALFMFGVCFTNHQSLIVAAIGVEVAIAAGNPRLGREVFFGNFIIYLLYLVILGVTGQHVFANLGAKSGMWIIFQAVGICSLLASVWLAYKSRTRGIEIGRSLAFLGLLCSFTLMLLNRGDSGVFAFFLMTTLGTAALFGYLAWKTWRLSREWLYVIMLGVLWVAGASFYFYMPVAGMTNPPMQWGYPRTVEGFQHALTRGQYEQPNPTNVITDPGRFFNQLLMLFGNVGDEFSWVYTLIAVVPYLFFFKLQRRERAWILGLTAIYLCLGVLLMILLNPAPDRASADLVKVFFTASHMVVAAMVGYGLALTAAFMATHYQAFRRWGLLGGGLCAVLAVYELFHDTHKVYFGAAGHWDFGVLLNQMGQALQANHYGLPVLAGLLLVFMTLVFLGALAAYQGRAPLAITLALFAVMPLNPLLNNWYDNEQHNHMFGYWFGHDMFSPPFKGKDGRPIYPEMTRNAILYGGTDPGRFCPTYMIFCESFTPHKSQPAEDQTFDRRDVYIITQNALADGTYLNYIRAHYNRSTQIDPPFFQELFRSAKEREANYETNFVARAVSSLDDVFEGLGARIEKRRRTYTSWFKGADFLDLPGLEARLRPGPAQDAVSKYLYGNLSPATRELLGGKGNASALRDALAGDLNRVLDRELEVKRELAGKQRERNELDQKLANGSTSARVRTRSDQLGKEITELGQADTLYRPERFKDVPISEYLQDFIKENPQSNTRVRLNRLLLEAAYPKELARSIGGVYPDREMYIATPQDSSECFNEYLGDAQRRWQHDTQFPNEPRQLRMGEDVRFDKASGRVTVAGQTAVMAINGLLTKVMFDHNPKNEFFVEESFPLDWMYPHLTPFGVIMKINRQPLPSLSDDILQRDHEFWKQYSKRLTGDIIDYDTPIKQITDWIEKTYLRRNFNGFTGDRKFIRDNDAQKAFSKLRSSIGGIYAWRLLQAPPQYRPKNQTEYEHLLREAEFTFRQSFAFCPYSPEAVFRYVNLLVQLGRVDDAILIAETCRKLDPYNPSAIGLLNNLEDMKKQRANMAAPQNQLQAMEAQVSANPTNFPAALELAKIFLQLQQTGRVVQLLDGVAQHPAVTAPDLIHAAQLYGQIGNWPRLEAALERLVKVSPQSPEAWYDLAGLKANLRKEKEALPALAEALRLSAERLKGNPKAQDLRAQATNDSRFAILRQTPEGQRLLQVK